MPKSAKKQEKLPLVIQIPPYIDPDAWAGFVDMRKKMKWVLTDRAVEIILRKLQDIAARGGDPNAALDQSVERCYRGVFEARTETVNVNRTSNGGSNGLPETRAERNVREAIELLDREEAEGHG
jgi:hypothetical protein